MATYTQQGLRKFDAVQFNLAPVTFARPANLQIVDPIVAAPVLPNVKYYNLSGIVNFQATSSSGDFSMVRNLVIGSSNLALAGQIFAFSYSFFPPNTQTPVARFEVRVSSANGTSVILLNQLGTYQTPDYTISYLESEAISFSFSNLKVPAGTLIYHVYRNPFNINFGNAVRSGSANIQLEAIY